MKKLWHWIYHHTWLHWTYEAGLDCCSIRYCRECKQVQYWDDHKGDWT